MARRPPQTQAEFDALEKRIAARPWLKAPQWKECGPSDCQACTLVKQPWHPAGKWVCYVHRRFHSHGGDGGCKEVSPDMASGDMVCVRTGVVLDQSFSVPTGISARALRTWQPDPLASAQESKGADDFASGIANMLQAISAAPKKSNIFGSNAASAHRDTPRQARLKRERAKARRDLEVAKMNMLSTVSAISEGKAGSGSPNEQQNPGRASSGIMETILSAMTRIASAEEAANAADKSVNVNIRVRSKHKRSKHKKGGGGGGKERTMDEWRSQTYTKIVEGIVSALLYHPAVAERREQYAITHGPVANRKLRASINRAIKMTENLPRVVCLDDGNGPIVEFDPANPAHAGLTPAPPPIDFFSEMNAFVVATRAVGRGALVKNPKRIQYYTDVIMGVWATVVSHWREKRKATEVDLRKVATGVLYIMKSEGLTLAMRDPSGARISMSILPVDSYLLGIPREPHLQDLVRELGVHPSWVTDGHGIVTDCFSDLARRMERIQSQAVFDEVVTWFQALEAMTCWVSSDDDHTRRVMRNNEVIPEDFATK